MSQKKKTYFGGFSRGNSSLLLFLFFYFPNSLSLNANLCCQLFYIWKKKLKETALQFETHYFFFREKLELVKKMRGNLNSGTEGKVFKENIHSAHR